MSEEKSQVETVYGVTEEMAFEAILEDRPLVIKFKVGPVGREKELELPIMWPDLDDEAEISARAAEFLQQRPDFMSQADIALARGRAVIEQLACDPYPAWLVGHDGSGVSNNKRMWRGKMRLQPNTGALRSPAVARAFYYAYTDVVNRFHVLAV